MDEAYVSNNPLDPTLFQISMDEVNDDVILLECGRQRLTHFLPELRHYTSHASLHFRHGAQVPRGDPRATKKQSKEFERNNVISGYTSANTQTN